MNISSKFEQKEYCWSQPERNDYHHWIMHTRSILGAKFKLQMTILIFWTKFTQKDYFQSKTEKVNTTTEIERRERVWTEKFSLKKPIECGMLWSEPWCIVSSVRMKFSESSLMPAVCLFIKISLSLHENSKSTMLVCL